MKTHVDAYACDICGKTTLNDELFYKCIHCGKDICKGVDCSYEITVTVHHNIPNGIPSLNTQARYRICKKCHVLNKPLCKELHELIMPKENAKFYRRGDPRIDRFDWERVKIK